MRWYEIVGVFKDLSYNPKVILVEHGKNQTVEIHCRSKDDFDAITDIYNRSDLVSVTAGLDSKGRLILDSYEVLGAKR